MSQCEVKRYEEMGIVAKIAFYVRILFKGKAYEE